VTRKYDDDNDDNNNNNNKPEIVKSKKDRTCLLFDVAMPSDTNVIQKEASTEIQ
jgi:hypothetical protein